MQADRVERLMERLQAMRLPACDDAAQLLEVQVAELEAARVRMDLLEREAESLRVRLRVAQGDVARLDALDAGGSEFGWSCRVSSRGHGVRLYQDPMGRHAGVREAIDAVLLPAGGGRVSALRMVPAVGACESGPL